MADVVEVIGIEKRERALSNSISRVGPELGRTIDEERERRVSLALSLSSLTSMDERRKHKLKKRGMVRMR